MVPESLSNKLLACSIGNLPYRIEVCKNKLNCLFTQCTSARRNNMGFFDKASDMLGGSDKGIPYKAILSWIDAQGGIQGILDKLRSGGLSAVVDSWISTRGLRANGTKTYVKEIIHCLN